jgi:Zn/Cd-binding protein ZinT
MSNIKKRTFEDYLKEWHCELFPMILDDELPDKFNDWLGSRDTQDIIDYAENYGKEQYIAGIDMTLNQIGKGVK